MPSQKTLMRKEFRKLLKDSSFKSFFPEYHELFEAIETKKIRLGCCGIGKELYQKCIEMVRENPEKWKKFLKVDRIQLFYGNKGHIL